MGMGENDRRLDAMASDMDQSGAQWLLTWIRVASKWIRVASYVDHNGCPQLGSEWPLGGSQWPLTYVDHNGF